VRTRHSGALQRLLRNYLKISRRFDGAARA